MIGTRRVAIFAFIAFFSCFSQAAEDWRPLSAVTSVHKLPNGVELRAGQSSVRVITVADGVVRVRVARSGAFPADHSGRPGPAR